MTLCEAYLGIDPDLDMWKYFLHVCHPQDTKAELTTSGGAVIHVMSGHKADPYLEIPMPRSMKGRRKKQFYLKNDDSAPLLAFNGGRPVPWASWGDGAVRKDLNKIQPLCEYLQQLWHKGLIGTHLLQTFFSHRIQLLQMQKMKMWAYPGPNCLDRLYPKELSTTEVETWIRKVLDSSVILSPGSGPDPFQRGITSIRVSTLGPISVAFSILSFYYTRDPVQGLVDCHGKLRDADSFMDALGRDADRASDGSMQMREERERPTCRQSGHDEIEDRGLYGIYVL
jgi:hypothetical protein